MDFISNNSSDYVFHIWTSNNRATVIPVIEEMGIANLIDVLVAKEDALLNKPYADGFELIYDDRHSLNDYIMVGDSNHDKNAAKRAGIDFVRVEHQFV